MINWNKIQRRNPQTGSLRWYPTIALTTTVTANEVIVGIVEKTTLTKVDVKACLVALEEVIIEQIKNGNSVRFGELGSFRPTLKTRAWDATKKAWGTGGCAAAKDQFDDETGEVITRGVSADNIAGVNVCFTKSANMNKMLKRNQLSFRNVPGEKPYKPKG